MDAELRHAASILTGRGLRVSAKWNLEMLLGMDAKNIPPSSSIPSWMNYYQNEPEGCAHHLLAKCYFDGKEFARAAHLLDSVYGEEASLKQALERRRGKNVDPSTVVDIYPACSFFLRCYSLYLDGERQCELERIEGSDSLAPVRPPVNPNLITLTRDIENWLTQRYENYQKKHVELHGTMHSSISRSGRLFDSIPSETLRSSGFGMQHTFSSPGKMHPPTFSSPVASEAPSTPITSTPVASTPVASTPSRFSSSSVFRSPQDAQQQQQQQMMSEEEEMVLDPLVLYLYALVLREQGRPQEATQFYLESIHRFPYNWSAWVDLAQVVTTKEELDLIASLLPNHWVSDCFRAYAGVEIQANVAALRLWQAPSFMFPRSDWIKAQVAKAFYNLRRFSRAQKLLQELRDKDPYRFEEVDILSNIYYVLDDNIRLSALVNACTKLERFRPEIYTAIGNYYSMKREHELATIALRKAFRLDPKYTSVWTLIGHEYIEMKNTAAATESYRRAIDHNPNDARAWYGLGQTYEILGIPLYAIYPYQKATSLRPQDPRIWSALGSCYYVLGQKSESLSCFQRALSLQEADRQSNDVLANVALAVEEQAFAQAGDMRVTGDTDSAKAYEAIAQFASAAAATAGTASDIATSAAAAETGDIAFKLAQLYAQFGDMKQAATQYASHIGLGENWIHFTHTTPLPSRPQQSLSTVNESLLFLAETALQDANPMLAHALASRILASGAGITPDASGTSGTAAGQRPLGDLLRAREILVSIEDMGDMGDMGDMERNDGLRLRSDRKPKGGTGLFYSDRSPTAAQRRFDGDADILDGGRSRREGYGRTGGDGGIRSNGQSERSGNSGSNDMHRGQGGVAGVATHPLDGMQHAVEWNRSETTRHSDDSNMDVSVASQNSTP